MEETKQHILTRLLKKANKAFGHPEGEIKDDPLVYLLSSIISDALADIYGAIKGSQSRILERLVHLISPDVLTGALPAHAIACALPIEDTTELSPEMQLLTQIKSPSLSENEKDVSKEIFFSPTSSFYINKASIRLMATGRQLYKVTDAVNKEILAYGVPDKELPASTLWLGIDEPEVTLDNSMFYFDLRNEANRRLFYNQLPKTTWHIGDQKLVPIPGYGNRSICGESLDLKSIIRRNDDVSGQIRKHINKYYKPYLITLSDNDGLSTVKENILELPSVLKDTFEPKLLDQIHQQRLRWICVTFPENISSSLLQDLVCVMNCFPVMNHRLHDLTYRLQDMVNIIPLQTKDIFLDLENVIDDEGKELNIDSFDEEKGESCSMLMRYGGVGRFDERNAASIVDYLLQLLRDESSAFAAMGNDFLNSELKQLQQVMNKLEQRLFSRELQAGTIPYLMIRNNKKGHWHNLFIRYWSTNGAEGNNIKAGTGLQLYSKGALKGNKALLITTTQGGRNKLSATDALRRYKSALLSKDRIITKEDVKAFCHYQLGERVQFIDVQRGVMIHPDQYQGFLKTIDVIIKVNQRSFREMKENGELKFWADDLKLLLEEKSAALTPYRVFIQEAA